MTVDPHSSGLGDAQPHRYWLGAVRSHGGRQIDELPLRRPCETREPDPTHGIGTRRRPPVVTRWIVGKLIEIHKLTDVHGTLDPPLGETTDGSKKLPCRRRTTRLSRQACAQDPKFIRHQGIHPTQRGEAVEPPLDHGEIGNRVSPEEHEDEMVEVVGLETTHGRAVHVVDDPLLDLTRGAGDVREQGDHQHCCQTSNHDG